MNKFTIATIILVVSVITVTIDLGVRHYLGRSEQTSVVKSLDIPEEVEKEISSEKPKAITDTEESLPVRDEPAVEPALQSGTLNEKLISEAGFSGSIQEEQFAGKVFQLLDITKNPVASISFYEILEDSTPVVSVTEIILPDEIRALQLYVLLQNKTKTYIDLSLNETNAYGDRSFYINHAKKPDEAFLTVKIGKNIYAFAYLKKYHPEIKKLIALLSS